MCRKTVVLMLALLVLGVAAEGWAAELAHRWSFNGDLSDSIGGRDATIADLGANNAVLSDNEVTLTGGAKGSSDYIDLADGIVSSLGDSVTFEAWATQISVQNWSRIFDFGTSTAENVFMSWTSGTTLTADRVEWLGPNGNNTLDNTNAPYTLGVEFHIVCVFDEGLVTWYTAPADSDSIGDAKGSFQSANRLSTLADTNVWLGRSQWEDNTANASFNEVRLWKGALTRDEIDKLHRMGPDGFNPNVAYDPSPADKAIDVPRDVALAWSAGESAATHDVYFGGSAEDIEAAERGDPKGVLVSQGQAVATYTPAARLEFEQTYYWRVDEIASDNTIFRGDLWSFTAEPFVYPIANVVATTSATNVEEGTGPENTVNGSGLDADDKHSINAADMWLGQPAAPGETVWIQFEFDGVYKVHEMLVWNYNVMFELMLGFGLKDVTVEYSTDGAEWATLGDFQFARGTARAGYAANTTVDFQGLAVKYVRLTVNSGYGMLGQYGLSEVRFLHIPVQAREPKPVSEATDVQIDAVLTWRGGREAASHEVYLGTDEAAVAPDAAPVATTGVGRYNPAGLMLDTTYYWRVDEVNDVEAIDRWEGLVWTFSTQEFVIVDNFESYTDDVEAGEAIFDTWLDGWVNGTGSTVGYMNSPFAEQTVVNSGRQSMPLFYEGNSRADFTMDAQDWTAGGATTLVLFFRGAADNGAGQLYVTVNGTKVTYPGVLTSPVWKQWNIDLASIGTNLANVRTFSIGVDGSGSGLLRIDDIRLYREAPEPIVPADPGTAGLVAYYMMDGNVQDSSGSGHNGTPFNDPSYAQAPAGFGQAIQFDGFADYVELPIGSLIASLRSVTFSTRILFDGTGATWQRAFDFGTGATAYMFLSPNNGATNSPRFAITTSAGGGESIVTAPAGLTPGQWHHIAVVIDADSMMLTLYVDGQAVDSTVTGTVPADLGQTTQNWLARSQYAADPYFAGSLDEFRIYNRALSAGEVSYLAGDR